MRQEGPAPRGAWRRWHWEVLKVTFQYCHEGWDNYPRGEKPEGHRCRQMTVCQPREVWEEQWGFVVTEVHLTWWRCEAGRVGWGQLDSAWCAFLRNLCFILQNKENNKSFSAREWVFCNKNGYLKKKKDKWQWGIDWMEERPKVRRPVH